MIQKIMAFSNKNVKKKICYGSWMNIYETLPGYQYFL